MTFWQGRSVRKMTGGRYRQARKKRRYELGSDPVLTKLGPERKKVIRTFGGNSKIKILSIDHVNVYDKENKIMKKAKIITVKENKADPHYVQRNIINKGAIVLTDMGLVKITSRPGQDGVLNGILIGK